MVDDGDDKDETKRRTRNLSEKKRRDQFNMLVHELSTMVSSTSNSRKMDKSTVLKSTISFLKHHNEITLRSRAHDVHEEWKPGFLSNEEFTYLLLEALEGFVIVFSSTGRICYVSEGVTSILGHNPVKLVNKSIFDITCEEDRPILYNLLKRNVSATEQIHSVSRDNEMVSFKLHLRRGALDFRDETIFELVTFYGHFRSNYKHLDGKHGYLQDMESSVLFVGTGRLHSPQLVRDVSLVDPSRDEFTSRHSLEWKFLFLDHRAPPIIGYLPFEVLGTSGYDYYHFDDLEKVVSCHEELMQKGQVTSGYYRFLTKGQQWIWLQTRFYITYHQWSSKPEFVVGTHRVISYVDISKSTKEERAQSTSIRAAGPCTVIKRTPSQEARLGNVSPSYMSEASDVFNSPYRTNSPVDSSLQVPKEVPSDDATMATLSPSYMSEASEAYGPSYRTAQRGTKRQRTHDSGQSDDAGGGQGSPSYMSEVSESYHHYRPHSQAPSVKSESSWRRGRRYAHGSDTGSVSGESHCSARYSCQEQAHKAEPSLAPQHGLDPQYLEPVPYVGAQVALPLPLRTLPVNASQDQAQFETHDGASLPSRNIFTCDLKMPSLCWEVANPSGNTGSEQLQRKHEELQEMIAKQQEQLQHVKEQLLLARLGILQPVINLPYLNQEPDQTQPNQLLSLQPSQPPSQQPSQPPIQQPSQPPSQAPSQSSIQQVNQPQIQQLAQPPIQQLSQPPIQQLSQPPIQQPSQPPIHQPSQPPIQHLSQPASQQLSQPASQQLSQQSSQQPSQSAPPPPPPPPPPPQPQITYEDGSNYPLHNMLI